ncbi:MAG: YDG domain-containing protein, partial [Bacteroidales bacterium]
VERKIEITVNPIVAVTFPVIAPICAGSAAPVLPLVSNEGITGTWTPAKVDSLVTTTYRFTPDAGQCADTSSLTIPVNPLVKPTFNAIGPICLSAAAPVLPLVSNEGITGTWTPAKVDSLLTTTYRFTPDAGQCADTSSLTIPVNPLVRPTFNAIGPFCLNATPPALPTASIEGITGTWTPGTISTVAFGTTIYRFVPDSGLCATTDSLSITISPETTPEFDPISVLCQNSIAPLLPDTSLNAIHGTWSPAIISTTTAGTVTYTFTPDSGLCAVERKIEITVNPIVAVTFPVIAPICAGSAAPVLPLVSNEGITGTWNPAIINTTIAGKSTYHFTPDSSFCIQNADMEITILPVTEPTFAPIGPFCLNAMAPALPGASIEGITGTWAPSGISTASFGTTNYVFTPDSGLCSKIITISIIVSPETHPVFVPIGPLCQNSTPPTLPSISQNGISGTWAPNTIGTTRTGATAYFFTPDAGLCASTDTLTVIILPLTTPVFDPIGPFNQNSVAPVLPQFSKNGITGTWNPSVINTAVAGKADYLFTPFAGQCADPVTITITVNEVVDVTITPVGPLCTGSGPVSLSGSPAGGIFSGPGVTGTSFDPALSGPGTFNVTYSYTHPNGWSKSASMDVIVNAGPSLIITNPAGICSPGSADLTLAMITAGSSPDLDLTYWIDAEATRKLENPYGVTSGTYYIKAVNNAGCYDIKPVRVIINQTPVLTINDPAPACEPDKINLTVGAVTAGSTPGLSYSYWLDADATVPFSTPQTAISGIYYIKGTTPQGCSAIGPVHVIITNTVGTPVFFSVANERCQGAGSENYHATADNTTALTYSLDAASVMGGNTINPSTGNVVYAASWSGTSVITVVAAGCNGPKSAQQTVVTIPKPFARISYTGTPFCKSNLNRQSVTIEGTRGGIYSASPVGLAIDPSTGDIIPAASETGVYTVTYLITSTGGCGNGIAETQVSISDSPKADISYAGAPFCTSGNPADVTFNGTPGGAFASTPAGLSIDTLTGRITPAASQEGNYRVSYTTPANGGCIPVTATVDLTITEMPVADFAYFGSPFCSNGVDPIPVFSNGGVAGTFTSTAGLVFESSATGQIDLSASLPGTYTITNTIPASGGCSAAVVSRTVTLTKLPVATFTYPGNPFCSNGSDPNPEFTGGGIGGTFTSSTGLVFIDIHTGQVDLSASTAGTYEVTNTIDAAGGCGPVIETSSITIIVAPFAEINYAGSPFCNKLTEDQKVSLIGAGGGSFSASPAGLVINSTTGAISPALSVPGTYTVRYSANTSGVCGLVNAETNVTINQGDAAIVYTDSVFCTTSGPATVNFTGSAGGVYSSTPAGLSISASTGEILPGSSKGGIYQVTYTKTDEGCGLISANARITISEAPVAEIAYAGSPFCMSLTGKQPVTFKGTTGGKYIATPDGLMLDSLTGEVTPSASLAGTYTISYKIEASGRCEALTANATVIISPVPSASIYYQGSPFCTSGQPVPVVFNGTTGGTFTSTPAGLTLNSTTGEITPSTSAGGYYNVTYTTPDNGCTIVRVTALVTIIVAPVAEISYNGSSFCPSDPPVTPVITGTRGGIFAAVPVGLSIDSISGVIDPARSLSGTYDISYSFNNTGGCGVVSSHATVAINSATIVTTAPKDQHIVYPASTGFGVHSTGTGLSYQWQVNSGSGYINLTDTGVYSGAFTDSLKLASPPISMTNYRYRVIVTGICAPPAISGEAILTISLHEFTLEIYAKGIDKVYDGNTAAMVTLTDNHRPGDQITVDYANAIFDTKNVGIDKTVTVSGITISGPDAGKYGFQTTLTTTANITPKPITVMADSGLQKVYGETDPIFTYTYTPELIPGDVFTGLLTRMPGENPGLYPIMSGTLSAGNNYDITFISSDFRIKVKYIIYVKVTADQTKMYGDIDPVLAYTYTPDLDLGDTFTGRLVREAGENVGQYHVSRGTLTTSPKYEVVMDTASRFEITVKPITVTAVADRKVYDGGNTSDKIPVITPNLAFDDTAEFTQTFNNKHVGQAKTMTPAGSVNDGNNGNNYSVEWKPVDLGIITPKPIVGTFTAFSKDYDATAAATIDTRSLLGAIKGDNITYVGGIATFDTPEVGIDKTVTGTGFRLAGTEVKNYTVNDIATTTADIFVRKLKTTIKVNASTFTHYSDQVTLTAVVQGGAPLVNGQPAAGSVTFAIEGRILTDNMNNPNIPLVITGDSLVASITVSILETTATGSMVPGTKEAIATFNEVNTNYELNPNPAKTTFDFSPGFNILVFPNPSPGPVNFRISVDVGSMVILDLYSSNGELVAHVFEGFIQTGESKTIPFKGHLAQGIYRYQVKIGSEIKGGNVIIIGVY